MKTDSVVVLLVEDEPAHAEIVRRNLEKFSYDNTIVHVSDGQEAMDYLNNEGIYEDPLSNPRPHLILLDLRLPRVDGLEVLKRIKNNSQLKTIPVVVLTTSDTETDIAKAYSLQVNSYLVKPIVFEEFTGLLHELGLYWINRNKYINLEMREI
ncbi:MAG: response regulator [Candidatus Cloacimonetes bacterium]|nr:response regulator [Candidatus Cloacimonadota bacterium]